MRNNEECPAPCCFTGPGILFLQLFWAAYARSAAFRAQTAAAQHADALFYPILVGKEKTSWERLVSEALPRFLAGTFAGAYQEQLLAEQREILK